MPALIHTSPQPASRAPVGLETNAAGMHPQRLLWNGEVDEIEFLEFVRSCAFSLDMRAHAP